MDSRGSSILERASSSEESASTHGECEQIQSYERENNFFDEIKNNPDMCTALHVSSTSLSQEEKPIQSTMNTNCRESQASNIIHGPLGSENKAPRNTDATVCFTNVISNNSTHTSNNPFKFQLNKANCANNNASKESQGIEKSEVAKMQLDKILLTINTITNLLKQLQELEDKEQRLKYDLLPKENEPEKNSRQENKRKIRPQILMKKMKCMLSTSNIGTKNDFTSFDSSNSSTTTTDPIEVSDNNELTALRSEKLQISIQTLSIVENLRDSIATYMPGVVRRRAQKCSSVSPSPSINGISSDVELPHLLGRCFNLSLNLRILTHCNFADPTIGCKVFLDFDVLENYLKPKIKQFEASLGIEQSKRENYLLSSKQLEDNINLLSIRNDNMNDNTIGCL